MVCRERLQSFAIASLMLPFVAVGGCSSTVPLTSSQPASNLQTAAAPNKQLKVVTTFLPVYLFTKAVAGEAARVDILIQPGTEVHEYQSTPADVQAIAQADVVVKNGLGIEEFLDGTIKSAENTKLKVIDASQGISPIGENPPVVETNSSGEKGEGHDHEHADEKSGQKPAAHAHEAENPHVWLDPVLAKKQVENIRDGLIAADPDHKATYQANAAAYIQQLSVLNQQFEQSLKTFKDRTFVTFHDAFPYLARRYQLKQVAVVAIPEDQLAPGDVKRAISAVQQFKVKAFLSEPRIDNKLLTGLSKDLSLKVYPLNSLESGQLDPKYYFSAMESNLQTLETAFR
ncbi:zinc ABC transporter substrate-binding protein [Kovacikia minuta CCNUW1]|uniref:metal ABC transporter solute-binding protein, Zn/Mn family n=1 Tax=Kovacikia minuta TaxID=2931930 RepID=UPI001CCFC621|nr:zinc ABC transporter substrate-binding protein [Kovacikia minuta]UBF27856.1 zinc ABC transporter substrate-binding protein [Kovacikia minuta CCNUW1]